MAISLAVLTFLFFIVLDIIVIKLRARRVEVQKVVRIKKASKKKRPSTEDRRVKQVFHTKKTPEESPSPPQRKMRL
jgi:hypothetical protein